MDDIKTVIEGQLRDRGADTDTLDLWDEIWDCFNEGEGESVQAMLSGKIETAIGKSGFDGGLR